jgi:hypothetical protein
MLLYFDMMGFDWEAEVEYDVTSWGSSDSWTEPGDPIEIEVNEIWISLDKGRAVKTPFFLATGAFWCVLEELFHDKICEKLAEEGPPDFEGDY